MRAVILAGGRGTRISEESALRPKPMITIGGWPILWHIMQIYAAHGITDFIVCLGHKGYVIKEYFANYLLHSADVVEFNLAERATKFSHSQLVPWQVTLVETGEQTQTGGRIKRIAPWVQDDEAFCLTYGDGVADIDVGASIAYHLQQGRHATVTAVSPPGRFGTLRVRQGGVTEFAEKPVDEGQWINGGFFVLSPRIFDYIADDNTTWEHEPLRRLATDGQLSAYHHAGFWQPMDTLRDRELLEQLWASGDPPWWKSPR